MSKLLKSGLFALVCLVGVNANAEKYDIDIPGMHAAIQFKVKHGGVSWLLGRFDDFEGSFNFDSKNLGASSVDVTIKTTSINSNHAERDVHLRSDDYLDVKAFPEASFKSTKFESSDEGMTGKLHGQLTLHGVTQDIVIDVNKTGEGDLFGSHRVGFEGTVSLESKDYKFKRDFGTFHLSLYVEGIQQ